MDEEIRGAAFVFDGHSIRPALSSKLWKFEGGVSVTEAGGDRVGGGEGPLAKQLQKKKREKGGERSERVLYRGRERRRR